MELFSDLLKEFGVLLDTVVVMDDNLAIVEQQVDLAMDDVRDVREDIRNMEMKIDFLLAVHREELDGVRVCIQCGNRTKDEKKPKKEGVEYAMAGE